MVSEGDGWLSELSCVPNKSLTPITLDFNPSFHKLGHQGQISTQQTYKESQSSFRCSVSLVRVSEGDGWVSEVTWDPNKSLTPITLVVSPSFHQSKTSGSDLAPNLQGESELIQV